MFAFAFFFNRTALSCELIAGCFYTIGLVALNAGVWAPLCMVLVSITLYMFRSVYGEAVRQSLAMMNILDDWMYTYNVSMNGLSDVSSF
jgi:hypothetical protein